MPSASSQPSLNQFGYHRDQSSPCARPAGRHQSLARAQSCQCLLSTQRVSRRSVQAVLRARHNRHLRRLQGRRLPDHRQRQGALGRGPAAGLDLQDSELDHRAGDRRGRGPRQGRLQVGRGDAQHRSLEQGSHLALGDRGVRGAGLSGDRAAHRARAHAEICRPDGLRQPRHRRRHRPVLAHRATCGSIPFSRSISSTGCAAACCRFPSAARN